MGPPASALRAAKALLVGPGDFRALDENGRLARPLGGREFKAWVLKNRSARDGDSRREWRLGARLGPNASRIYPQMVSDLDATHPGIRKVGFRELLVARRRPGQVGVPPCVATDAQLGFPFMACQSAEVRFDR